jgi:hypothetical protein
MNFQVFKQAVQKQFAQMTAEDAPLFRVDVPGDQLWDAYLAAFPDGSNPIFRKRTEHDCSCCRQFVKNIGNVVAVIDGEQVSIWDVAIKEGAYQTVADRLSQMVKASPIVDIFLHYERTVGQEKTFEQMDGKVHEWNHFSVTLPQTFVKPGKDIATLLGEARADYDVLRRSLKEIKLDAVEAVLELIDQNSLYRGEEHKHTLQKFLELKNMLLCNGQIWLLSCSLPKNITRLRNTSIGTLLTELSGGMELEDAVKRFEKMVAPTNYKRPTAIVTKPMIENAKAKIEELGLTHSLERRYAVLEDITVNNILFADRAARKAMGSVFDAMLGEVDGPPKNLDKVEEVHIDKFLADILPKVKTLEVLMSGAQTGNLVSLITAADPTAPGMFKWDNKFSWSYNGELADSIKERVKAAGGNVTGDLCCRLAWDYTDDLDFHMTEPHDRIYFGRRTSVNGGQLDVDANGGNGMMKNPVENIFYQDRKMMRDGVYVLSVHNFNRRSNDTGFEVEIEFDGERHSFGYEGVIKDRDTVKIANIHVKKGVFTVEPLLPSSKGGAKSVDVWGIKTNVFQKVNVLMHSPNHWDDQGVGNKHYFFMLDGCANPGQARGFYNEFLRNDLDPHRKVFEMVGRKLKPEAATRQLSGLGFSSTQRNSILCRVTGAITRIIKITF